MKNIFIFVSFFLTTFCLCAQEQPHSTEINEKAKLYIKNANNLASIYSGREEPKYPERITNHPYLESPNFRKGTLSVDGCVYHEMPMRLNQYVEELAVSTPDERLSILVPREYLDYAIIDSMYISFQKPQSADGKALPEGYYVRIHNGKSQVWKRSVSSIENSIRQVERTLDYRFVHKVKMYIYTDGAYHLVKNKRSLLKVFEPKKKELQKMIRKLELSFIKSPEEMVITVAKYYDEINK